MIQLLLVDDEPAILKGLRMRLAAEPDITVIGGTALSLAPALRPDIALIDFQMPHMDGIATAKALLAICPHIAVIMLSIHDATATRACAEDAGVSAFITKRASMKELLTTIRQTAIG